jgi:hypothetical protein
MDPEANIIEASTQANLEVAPAPSSGGMDDWASRLDAEIGTLNDETGATKYGKADEGKTAAEKRASKVKGSSEKTAKTSDKKAEKVKISKEEETTEDKGDAEGEEPKGEDPGENVEKTEETPKGLTEKAAVKWGELRAEAAKAKEYAKEIETLKQELEKAKATTADTSEVERLRQINQEYEQELSVARVEATQEYKANVVEPMVGVVGYLNSLSERYELDSKEMLAAFAEMDPNKQGDLIADIAANMNERDRLRFYAAADDYNEIIRRRDYYQQSSRERMEQIEQQRQEEIARQQAESERTTSETKAAYEKATSKVFEDLKKSVPVLEDEEVAAEVQRLAKEDYSGADPELKSYLAHSGALLPHILKALKAAKGELEEANKKIAGYRNGSPKAGSGSSDSAREVDGDVGFLEALEQQLG